ncbi:MAG: S41 family peptidase [Acidiferrobacterales bacterium]|nr:S41 family peptidase [Acidiferrobacterales bacterium]
MHNTIRYTIILVMGIFVGAIITLDHRAEADREDTQVSAGKIPFEEIKTLSEVFQRIKTDYVEPVSDKKLLEDALQGMTSGLDPHSAYLDPEGYKELRIGTEGQFGGLGIEVTMDNGFVKVITPIEDTPAAKAGLKPGDLIIRLGDTPVKGMSLNDAVRLMRGKPGSKILLTIIREGHSKPLKIKVERDIIKLHTVKERVLEPGYGYLRITQFQGNTDKSVYRGLNKLVKENHGHLKGLVLDLRNNPGGVLPVAVKVADAFIRDGLIVYTKGRTSDSELEYSAAPDDLLNGAPLVVLVNGGSASASEIVAGALQDHKRAIIMGTKTFGKGSVQTILPISNGGALKLTTARYYTPKGRSIQAAGIEPDIVTEQAKLTHADTDQELLKESDLAGHLQNNTIKPGQKSGSGSVTDVVDTKDYQLQEALNLLKGISIVKNGK